MDRPTKEIETPISKIKIQLHLWITGRQAAYIDAAAYEAMEAKPNIAGLTAVTDAPVTISKMDTQKVIQETEQRETEVYLAKVGEETDPKKCFDLVFDLPAYDYAFVRQQIEQIKIEAKKK